MRDPRPGDHLNCLCGVEAMCGIEGVFTGKFDIDGRFEIKSGNGTAHIKRQYALYIYADQLLLTVPEAIE